jgi:glycerophosphoryl diester phosphodiesterase
MNPVLRIGAMLVALAPAAAAADAPALTYGDRPFYLVDLLPEGELKTKLQSCTGQSPQKTDFSIGHRGAALQFPEHTDLSFIAAARQGAGIIECDVTFTADKELVCRHAQNDLHTTTNILSTPLAETCVTPFTPASGDTPAAAECRTSELTLAQFRELSPKMDAFNKAATTVAEFQAGTPAFRTDAYVPGAKLMTHAESIELIRALGGKFTPELKTPSVDMPFDGFSQEAYAQKMIDEYKAAGIPAADVWPQSFNLEDVVYWIENEPEFGAQAVYLDDSDAEVDGFDPMDPETWAHSMQELADMGVKFIAPPMWYLVTLNDAGEIVPSAYATEAKAAGLNIISWSMERSGTLTDGGGWYFQSVADAIKGPEGYLQVLDVLAQDVGIVGIFSDWPATVTYYANCMGL